MDACLRDVHSGRIIFFFFSGIVWCRDGGSVVEVEGVVEVRWR